MPPYCHKASLIFMIVRLSYRPRHANVHGSSGQTESHVPFWDYVNSLHSESTLLYNFEYKPDEQMVCFFTNS